MKVGDGGPAPCNVMAVPRKCEWCVCVEASLDPETAGRRKESGGRVGCFVFTGAPNIPAHGGECTAATPTQCNCRRYLLLITNNHIVVAGQTGVTYVL